MPDSSSGTDVVEAISKAHQDDKGQLEVIFSEEPRLIVEAPAGYGKTKTMISKIAYILATHKLPEPKKILALTFSVNAAYKIKRDVSNQLPALLKSTGLHPGKINERVFVSNYHGFSRHVLKLYGYLIHQNLKNIETLTSLDESNPQQLTAQLAEIGVNVSYADSMEMKAFSDAIKIADEEHIIENRASYLAKVKTFLLPHGFITFNAIILFVTQLFLDFPEILNFYRLYFPIIIIDEFQDTNLLNYDLISRLISEKTRLIFIGDPLQRIYGFIGAIPKLMEFAGEEFGMAPKRLKKNYRFIENPAMLLLDQNLRSNASNPASPKIVTNAPIQLWMLPDQTEEARWVLEKAVSIVEANEESKVAILVRNGITNNNVQQIVKCFEEAYEDYFFGLFRDDDHDYVAFHHICLSIIVNHLKGDNRISRANLDKIKKKIRKAFEKKYSHTIISLLDLVGAFFDRFNSEYLFLDNDDKISFILDTFENRALRQNMEFLQHRIFLSTVHGAKGLEWDYVILPDMEPYVFPNYYGLCGKCKKRKTINGFCILNYHDELEADFIEELSVFYVAATRGRKELYFCSSSKRIDYHGRNVNSQVSCLLSLPGIAPV